MGVLHTAIMINKCLIDFNNSHLVMIRPATGTYTFLCATLKDKGKSYVEVPVAELDNFLDKVWKWISFTI